VASAGTAIAAHGATDDWSEKVVTWNTAPPLAGKALDTQTFPASYGSVCCTWDVTAYVAGEREGDEVATLVLAETSPPQGSWVWFAESLDGAAPGASLEVELEEEGPRDAAPPTIELKLLKEELWPPNHKMVLCATVSASDDLGKPLKADVKVSNSEGPEANGSDEEDPDVDLKPADGLQWEVWLRAERTGAGDDRTYTITATATDASGKASVATGTVTVPHDQGKGNQKGQ
jgi:hypothetical protein